MAKIHTPWFGFLQQNSELRQEIVECLAGGTPSRWEQVAIKLSTTHREIITCPWIDEIKLSHQTPMARSQAFVDKLHTDSRLHIIVGEFLVACMDAGCGRLAEHIKAKMDPHELSVYGF